MATAKKKTTTIKETQDDVATSDPQDMDVELSIIENVDMSDDEDGSDEKVANPNVVKKKEIYDHVTVSTGLRKRDVREAVDSMLEFMHICLTDGKDMQMPPLGKIKTIKRGTDDDIKIHHKVILKKIEETEEKAD
jgi:DNA-binding protein HU-alpha